MGRGQLRNVCPDRLIVAAAHMHHSPEEHEVHGLLAQVVELVQVALDNGAQVLQVPGLRVRLVGRLGVGEVAVHQRPHVVLCHFAVLVKVEVFEQL